MPERDSSHRQVIRTDLDLDSIARHDSNIVHSHFSTYVGKDFEIAFIEFDAKPSVGKILEDCAIEFDSMLLSRLISCFLPKVPSSRHEPLVYQESRVGIIEV